jgi:hypothetical protein
MGWTGPAWLGRARPNQMYRVALTLSPLLLLRLWVTGGIAAWFRQAPMTSIAVVCRNRSAVTFSTIWPRGIASLGSIRPHRVDLVLGAEVVWVATPTSLLRLFDDLMLGKRSSGRCGLAQVWHRHALVLSCRATAWPGLCSITRKWFPFSSRPSAALWLGDDACALGYGHLAVVLIYCFHYLPAVMVWPWFLWSVPCACHDALAWGVYPTPGMCCLLWFCHRWVTCRLLSWII